MLYYEQEVRRITEEQRYTKEIVDRVVTARQCMDTRFAEKLSLKQIAGEACMSRFGLVRQFRKHYGSTPWQYLTRVRLREAASLLRQGMSVTTVCFEVGFESPTTFAGLFRRHRCISPARYRSAEKSKIGEVCQGRMDEI